MHNFTKKALVLVALCALSVGSAYAQIGFQEGKIFLGVNAGYLDLLDGGLGVGLSGEYAYDDNIGIGADIFYISSGVEQNLFGTKISTDYSQMAILVTGSYHLSPKKKFDPFAKIGLGYFIGSSSYSINDKVQDPPAGFTSAYPSAFGYLVEVGAKYHVSSTFSLQATVGYPRFISGGLNLAFGGPEDPNAKKETTDTAAPSTNANRYGIYLGAYIGGKGAFNVNIPDGRKGGPGFAPEFGAMIYLPFGKKSPIGANIEIGANSYQFINKPNKDAIDTFTITEQYNYLTFAPSLNIAGFKLGVLFGFPTSASAKNRLGGSMAGSTITDSATEAIYRKNRKTFDEPYDPDMSEFLGTLVEARLGGMIPLLDDDTGRLDLHIQAGYVLTGLYDDYTKYSYTQLYDDKGIPKKDSSGKLIKDSGLNPQPVTFSIGLSYAFKIPFGK